MRCCVGKIPHHGTCRGLIIDEATVKEITRISRYLAFYLIRIPF